MDIMQWLFDIVLGLSLLSLAWLALTSEYLFKAIVLFIVFGLLMALTWVRLNAPDVALAEGIIGAGLTGALLLAALDRLREARLTGPGRSARQEDPGTRPKPVSGKNKND